MAELDIKPLEGNTGRWATQKPKDYKGKDLDNAIKSAKNFNKDLKKTLAELNGMKSKLDVICSAATKTQSDLEKLAKDKKGNEAEVKKYDAAIKLVADIYTQADAVRNRIP